MLNSGDVILALQIEPELRAVAEIAAEPHAGVGGDRSALVEDVRNAAGRDAKVKREPAGAEPARFQLAFEGAARMCSERHGLSPVVITPRAAP
jgi:hypothetical protein